MKHLNRKRSPKRKGSRKGSRKSPKLKGKGSKKSQGKKGSKNCMKDGVLVSILKGNCPTDWKEVSSTNKKAIKPFSGKKRLICVNKKGSKVEVYDKSCPKGFHKSSPKKLKFRRGKRLEDIKLISARKDKN